MTAQHAARIDWVTRVAMIGLCLTVLVKVWNAGEDTQKINDSLDAQKQANMAFVDKLNSQQLTLGYHSRQIESLGNNVQLMNQKVHAPQIPMPKFNIMSQPATKKDNTSSADTDPFLAKDKPAPPLLAVR